MTSFYYQNRQIVNKPDADMEFLAFLQSMSAGDFGIFAVRRM